jgi:hypothetical protein
MATLPAKEDARLKFLRQAKPGSWLAVSEDGYELLGNGDTPEEALEQAKKKGCDEPVLTMVPPEWRPRILCCE